MRRQAWQENWQSSRWGTRGLGKREHRRMDFQPVRRCWPVVTWHAIWILEVDIVKERLT